MSPALVFLVVLACTFGSMLLAVYVAGFLPPDHLTGTSKETIHAIMGVMALLTAVVLGLLIYSAKTAFDTKDTEFRHASAKIVLLDRVLAHYGPEAAEARKLLREAVEKKLGEFDSSVRHEPGEPMFVTVEKIQDTIRAFAPTSEAQRWLKDRALDVTGDIAEARWFLLDDLDSAMPVPFLMILVFWLALIFFCYGLFSPVNFTVLAIMFLCAISLSISIYLVLEMDNSLDGPIAISAEPLSRALAKLGQ
jgi:hypothetical protein